MALGPVFWIIVALGAAAVFVFLERLFDLRRAQIDWNDFVKGVANVLESGGPDEALAICDDAAVPVANVVAAAIRHRGDSARLLREAVDAQGRAEIGRLDRRLASLAIIGQVAPLAGLFGAVVGFIRTLLAANAAAVVSRAELFGASMTSLVCVAAGIAVAIAVTVFYGILRVRLDRIVVELEAAASQFIGRIASAREAAK